jgi:S1-C subfamily serine protease
LVDFAVDENDEQTLIVARSRLPAGTLDLHVGDVILGVGSPARAVSTATDLFDALRGKLGSVSLQVARDGRTVTLNGQWPAAAKITERRGLWISGALIAEAEPLTNGLISGSPALMVHYVSPGSEAESAGLDLYDLLMTVDRKPVDSLATLQQRASEARSSGKPLELMLLRIASEAHEEYFTHQLRLLPVEELQDVGQ